MTLTLTLDRVTGYSHVSLTDLYLTNFIPYLLLVYQISFKSEEPYEDRRTNGQTLAPALLGLEST